MKQFEKIANILAAISLTLFILLTTVYVVLEYNYFLKLRDIPFFTFGYITLLIMIIKSNIWKIKAYRKFIALQIFLFLVILVFQVVHEPNVIALYICFPVLIILYFIRLIKKEKSGYLTFLSCYG